MKCKKGYTFVEIMLILATVGLFAALTIPSVIYRADNNDALMQTKAMASELQRAVTALIKKYPGIKSISPKSLVDSTKFIQMVGAGNIVTASISCNNDGGRPSCFKYPDGGVLIVLDDTQGSSNIYYHYDPDGRGTGLNDLPGVELRISIDFYSKNIRIRTKGVDTGNAADDPDYVRDWTKL